MEQPRWNYSGGQVKNALKKVKIARKMHISVPPSLIARRTSYGQEATLATRVSRVEPTRTEYSGPTGTKAHELTTVRRQHRLSHLDAFGTVRSTSTLPMNHAKITLQLDPTLKTPNLTDT
jgi:hypothetical protein